MIVLLSGPALLAKKKQPQEAELQRLARTQVQSALMSFSDELGSALSYAADRLRNQLDDPGQRQEALLRKLRPAYSSMVIAAGPNADVALVDMVVLVVLERAAVEGHWIPTVFGEAGEDLLATLVDFETKIWALGDKVFTPQQHASLEKLLETWQQENEPGSYGSFQRLGDFAEERLRSASTESRGAFSTLKRTVSEVEEARLLADRAFFFGQRLPVLVSWQMEYTMGEILTHSTFDSALQDASQIAETISRLAEIADSLPEDIDRATESTFERAAELLVDQRTEIIGLLESQDPRFRSALADVNSTLDQANGLTVETQQLVAALDELTTSLDVNAGTIDKLPEIVEVRGLLGEASEVVSRSVELTESVASLLASSELESSITRLEELEAAGDRWIGKAFRAGAALTVLFFACALVTALVYRRFGGPANRTS